MPVVGQFAHKHVSLGVLLEHYLIGGQYLLAAIKEVLGCVTTVIRVITMPKVAQTNKRKHFTQTRKRDVQRLFQKSMWNG